MKKLKRLGEGYIWFGQYNDGVGGYTSVTLATKPSNGPGAKLVRLKLHRLGAWKKVRLLVEVIE